MVQSDNGAVVGADAVAVESIIITLLSPFIFGLSPNWQYYWIFQSALGGVIVIMLFRVMAGKAETPNIQIIQRTLRWSSILLQISFIGAFASISIYVAAYQVFLTPVILFTSITFAFAITFALLDQLVLGEYAKTWTGIIYQETGDNAVGWALRNIADFGKEQIEAVVNDESASTFQRNIRAVFLGIVILSLLFIISLPAWFVFAEFFGNWAVAGLVLMSILFLRDVTRYIYINYGAARSLTELSLPLRWEIVATIVKGILLASVLGHLTESLW